MNANDVIESYIADVAAKLPRKQRDDVALELRSLLHDELKARAEALGRSADAAMAIDMARAFGRPADVAARYRPPLTIIDPADGPTFVRASVIGLAIIWSLGLLSLLRTPVDSTGDMLLALGRWWGGILIPSLWWPGLLVVSFGTASWVRRQSPQTSEWKPRAADRVQGGSTTMVMGLVGILCGLSVLVDPRGWLEALSGGRAAPAALEALTYTDAFRHRQAPWLFVLLLLNIPILVAVMANGRWSNTLRRIWSGLSLLLCAVLVWTVLDGPVFQGQASDRAIKPALVVAIAYTLFDVGMTLYRSARPGPNRLPQA